MRVRRNLHLPDELADTKERVTVQTKYGPVTGGRAKNGSAVFLEIPYALPPRRFEDPEPLPDGFKYEEGKEYVYESKYCVQPRNDGQAMDMPYVDKVGIGGPSEDCLFLNIVAPPSFPSQTKLLPTRVYIHGGFLQFGSPHGLGSQQEYVAAERQEVWVNIAYRLSAFGFLAAENPQLSGNYGFKDQWLALEWVKNNIQSFGGDPNDIQLTGLSAGSYSVHMHLHKVSRLPEGQQAPFQSAILQSNSILTEPFTPAQYQAQFEALCRALDLDPNAPDILTTLRDESKVPSSSIVFAIEGDKMPPGMGTFRACSSNSKDWLPSTPDLMTWQSSGDLARGLKAHGVRSVVVGDMSEEWFLYSIAHPITHKSDILPALGRYMPKEVAEGMLKAWGVEKMNDGDDMEAARLCGEILSTGQVYLSDRLLARDLMKEGFPVLRYTMNWAPEKGKNGGYVTHASDRPIWSLRLSALQPGEADVARRWLNAIKEETTKIEAGEKRDVKDVLVLKADASIGWEQDKEWDRLLALRTILPGEI